MSIQPENLRYTDTHEWVSVDSGTPNVGTIGISAFAVEQLTDLVFMALPEVGSEVSQGQPFGEVESVKAVSSLNSPVTGKVTEVHGEIIDSLESLNTDPYEGGWLIKVELTNPGEVEQLMNFEDYTQQCNEAG